jgi:hypothetical protein
LILQLHQILLAGVRGQEKLPGEFRTSPVWVGSPTDSPDTAVYVPLVPTDLPELLTDWETFVNTPDEPPALVRCGLIEVLPEMATAPETRAVWSGWRCLSSGHRSHLSRDIVHT